MKIGVSGGKTNADAPALPDFGLRVRSRAQSRAKRLNTLFSLFLDSHCILEAQSIK